MRALCVEEPQIRRISTGFNEAVIFQKYLFSVNACKYEGLVCCCRSEYRMTVMARASCVVDQCTR